MQACCVTKVFKLTGMHTKRNAYTHMHACSHTNTHTTTNLHAVAVVSVACAGLAADPSLLGCGPSACMYACMCVGTFLCVECISTCACVYLRMCGREREREGERERERDREIDR